MLTVAWAWERSQQQFSGHMTVHQTCSYAPTLTPGHLKIRRYILFLYETVQSDTDAAPPSPWRNWPRLVKAVQALLFIRPLRQWHLWRPMSFHIELPLRCREWVRQPCTSGLRSFKAGGTPEVRAEIILVLRGRWKSASGWTSGFCVPVMVWKSRRETSLLSFPQSSP